MEVEAKYPQLTQDQEAADGEAAHWVGASVLKGGPGTSVAVGSNAPNGVVLDDEIIESAQVYIDDVTERAGAAVLHIEEFVWCPSVHPDNGGTPDLWWINGAPGGWVLHVYDFKHGHRFVDAFENWQCLDYASGILDLPALRGYDRNEITVEINVVQPRSFHPTGIIRRWTLNAGSDLPKYVEQMKQRAGESYLYVGAACRDCRGRHACPALQVVADGIADEVCETYVVELPPDALGAELRMLERAEKLLDARLTGLREQATMLIRAGTHVPFFQLKQSFGREKWNKPVEEIILLGELLGLQLAKPAAITPAQARKLGVTKEITTLYAGQAPGEMKITPVTEADVRKVFSK